MVGSVSKLPVKTEKKAAEHPSAVQMWHPFTSLRHEIDRLFEDFDPRLRRFPLGGGMFDIEPLWRRGLSWGPTPAVDIIEKDTSYEVTVELPGMDEKNIDVKLSNGNLTIKGEKQEEKEEKKKDYYLHERHFGSFERSFAVPEGVDTNKIEATFRKGVLTMTLPKKPEAQKPAKKIEVKAA